MAAQNLVIVESPAKAKTINKYLGPDYEVLASYGHVRDLPPKDGSVRPEEDFAMSWQMNEKAGKNVKAIADAAKKAKAVYLATDPDREGEAISWHIKEILKEKKASKDTDFFRVTFTEITKKAVQEAFQKARELDSHLIEAYLARRALDYLVGFNLSPVLWRKLPGSKSAGRVQSVALRLICEREEEIEKFRPQEYWSVHATMQNGQGDEFKARLTHLDGKKLDKFDLASEQDATRAVEKIKSRTYQIDSVEAKQIKRNPAPPFITSSLQQESARKLGFAAGQTMRLAQKLYEGVEIDGETVGLITYMRTDGTNISEDAVMACREVINTKYGANYLPSQPRLYKSKAKNAQEAHEAIRPTDVGRFPEGLKHTLDDQLLKLYTLIWKRTMASQMASALLDSVTAIITDGQNDVTLRATGNTIGFDGFLTLYQEGRDDADDDEDENRLPPLKKGEKPKLGETVPDQHFTQPPPRYTEASLVKKLEELGIGRPSTYASILQVLQDRNYVRLDKKRFYPEDRGRIVTTFLIKFFEKYVDYDFTANLEDELDAISAGKLNWKQALREFWTSFHKVVEETKGLTLTEVIDHLDAELGPHFFPQDENGNDPRSCKACDTGRLSLKLGKYGAFIGCSNYPECKFTKPLIAPNDNDENSDDQDAAAKLANEPKNLGNDPQTGRKITLRRGPYGPYVQLDPQEGSKEKPKRQGIPKGFNPELVTLDDAVKLLSLPRHVGDHPETGEKIEAGIGRYGPYLKYQGKFKSLPAGDDVLSIGMNRAVELLAQQNEKKKFSGKTSGGKASSAKASGGKASKPGKKRA